MTLKELVNTAKPFLKTKHCTSIITFFTMSKEYIDEYDGPCWRVDENILKVLGDYEVVDWGIKYYSYSRPGFVKSAEDIAFVVHINETMENLQKVAGKEKYYAMLQIY